MEFEYDNSKSAANKDKHGIDFASAQALWEANPVEVRSLYPKEARALVIGTLKEKYWTAIITYRGDVIRIISVRRSRKQEVEYYEKNNNR